MTVAAASAAAPRLAERFAQLADGASALLRGSVDAALIANPYLHPRNMHPANLELYGPMLRATDEPRSDVKTVLADVRSLGTALVNDGADWHGDTIEGSIDIVFVSHLLRLDQAESGEDLYYGNLPELLEGAGLRCATVLINHTGLSWSRIAPIWRSVPNCRVLLASTCSPGRELANGRALARAGRTLVERADVDPSLADVALRAAKHARSGSARSAMRIGQQIAALARRLKPRVLVTTYEGHAWERLVMMLARQAVPGIECVGYSHAVLFPESRAMSASLGGALDPDQVLTAGSITLNRIAQSMRIRDARLSVLGSVRRGVAASDAKRPPRCLVLPEGLISESVPLIEAAAESATLAPGISFRIRLHPVLRREQLLSAQPALRNLPANVEWSEQGPLDKDFDEARWLLYRGTSAVFQGVEAGVKPYYLGLPGEPCSIDPLAELEAWRVRVCSGKDLASALLTDLPVMVDARELAIARKYCADYFAPLDAGMLIRIADKQLSGRALEDRASCLKS